MINHIENKEGGGAVRAKLNEVIDVTNTVEGKVDKIPTAVPGNAAVFGENGVIIDSGVTPGGGAGSNVPYWEDVQNIPLPIGYVVQYNGRFFSNQVEGNQGNTPPLEGDDDYWAETSKSASNGTPLWAAGFYDQALSEVLWLNTITLKYEKYVLLIDVSQTPFESLDIETEIAAGAWQLLGGAGESGAVDKLDFIPQNSLLNEVEGRVQYDALSRELVLDLGNGVRQSLSSEILTNVRNPGVSALLNGRFVRSYQFDEATGFYDFVYADNSTEATAYVDAMLTEDAPANGGVAKGAKSGTVHGLNTLGGTEGAPVYLGVQGQFTPTPPSYPSKVVVVGTYGRIHATLGEIEVNLQKSGQYATNDLQTQIDLKAMQNPGICQKCPILPVDIVIDPVANTLTIATARGGEVISAANPMRFYTDGGGEIKKWEKTAPVVFPTFTNTYGVWYFHFDNTGEPVATQVPWGDFNIIATVYRFLLNDTLPDAEKIVVRAWECHLNDISASDHAWKHAQGTINVSGFDFVANVLAHSAGVPTTPPNADGRNSVISLTTGKNSDDGLEYTVTNSAVNAKFNQDMGHLTASTLTSLNSGLFKVRTNDVGGKLNFLPATRFPFPFNATTNYPEYLTTAGVRTAVADGRWMVVYLYSLQDDKFGEAVKVVTAETDFTSFALAQAHSPETLRNLYTTFRDKEIRQLHKAIGYVKYTGGQAYNVACKYMGFVEISDFRASKQLPVNASTSVVLDTNVVMTAPPPGFTATTLNAAYSELAAATWRENLTAWTTAETTVNLTSQLLRDFGTTPVTVQVTLTATAVTSPRLAEYAFKFVFGTGGSFILPSGVTLSTFSDALSVGSTYEATILKGKIKYSKI